MSYWAISRSKKATSSKVMLMLAPGTTMMRFWVAPFSSTCNCTFPTEEGVWRSVITRLQSMPSIRQALIRSFPKSSSPTLPTMVTRAPSRAA